MSVRIAERSSRRQTVRRPRRLDILITAGPTREFFDSIRFISNPSSGKMGYAIARAAASRGHRVTLVSGPVALMPPQGVKTVHVTTAAEMAAESRRAFRTADAAVFAAAVCDYRPRQRAKLKIAKSARPRRLDLVPTEDIAASLGRCKGRRVTIAFALEDRDGRAKAERKLRRKNCDAIVLNGPENVGGDLASAQVLVRSGSLTADGFQPTVGDRWVRWPRASKARIAIRLVRLLERLAEYNLGVLPESERGVGRRRTRSIARPAS